MSDGTIYIRDNTPQNNILRFLPILAGVLVLIGVGGLLLLLFSSSDNNDNVDQLTGENNQIENENQDDYSDSISNPSDSDITDEPGSSNPPTETADDNLDETPEINSDELDTDENTYVFFPNNQGEITPFAYEKQESGEIVFILSKFFSAADQPNAQKTWTFANANVCEGSRSFAYNITGRTINVEICREVNQNVDDFIDSAYNSLINQSEISVESVRIFTGDNCYDHPNNSC